ncbi:YbaB/EbfC family nucleoid-associated protein [Chloroflexota bacterium]
MNRQMIRQAQELQARLSKIQEELAQAEVEGTAGGGVVKVVVNGHQEVLAVKISPEVVTAGDVEMLEDLVLSAVNEAMSQAQALAEKRMGAATGGLKLPGIL